MSTAECPSPEANVVKESVSEPDHKSVAGASNLPAWLATGAAVLSALLALVAAFFSSRTSERVAALSAQNEQRIAEQARRVEKAALYASIVGHLSDPETSGFAVLAMWQASENDQERRLVLATALMGSESSRRAVDALMAASPEEFGRELRSIYTAALNRRDLQLADKVNSALFGSVQTDVALPVLLKAVDLDATQGRASVCGPNVDQIISLARADASLVVIIEEASAESPAGSAIFDYLLYVLGKPDRFRKRMEAPAVERTTVETLFCAALADEDWPRAFEACLRFLSAETDGFRRSSAFQAFDAIHAKAALPDAIRRRVLIACRDELLRPDAYEYARLYSMLALCTLSEDAAVAVISDLLASGSLDAPMLAHVESVVDRAYTGRGDLRSKRASLSMPEVRAGPERWRDWRAAQTNYLEQVAANHFGLAGSPTGRIP
ncbi:MAG: hypothetical protein KF902_07515 [Phycisphaeraceae bacterium]|nr:hypothetical protein [Phycisphaeraceae bacterium]QYK49173.1 MAG: hypothetical protein KF838_04805 [Phycisphaeraceae bacterium]